MFWCSSVLGSTGVCLVVRAGLKSGCSRNQRKVNLAGSETAETGVEKTVLYSAKHRYPRSYFRISEKCLRNLKWRGVGMKCPFGGVAQLLPTRTPRRLNPAVHKFPQAGPCVLGKAEDHFCIGAQSPHAAFLSTGVRKPEHRRPLSILAILGKLSAEPFMQTRVSQTRTPSYK
jgi:hypothetical protein